MKELLQSSPLPSLLDVYVAAVPPALRPRPVDPPEREREIFSPRNESLRRERYAVWRLLEQALRRSFGIKMSSLRFEKLQSGQWVCDGPRFSLSHAGSAVAVAVSDAPVGVDLEVEAEFYRRFEDAERLERLEKRCCTPGEKAALRDRGDFLALWTKKESIFKAGGYDFFEPAGIDTAARQSVTRLVELPERCAVSVCGARLDRLRWFTAVPGEDEAAWEIIG